MYNDPNQPEQPSQPSGQPSPSQEQWGQEAPTQYVPPPQYGQQYGQPPPQYGPPPQQYGQAQYGGVPPMPNYAQPPKKSLRWLWITLAIVGGVLVLGCAGCAVASFAGIGFFAKTILGPTTAASAYYQAIKNQDYAKAYTYLDTSGVTVQGQQVTQTAFTTAAQLLDSTEGQVTSFTQTNINVTNNTATVTMNVTRSGHPSYDVQLQLQQVGNDWKIVSADNI